MTQGQPRTKPPRPSLLQPSSLEPVHLDLRRVFWVGTGLWALGLVVAIVLTATGLVEGRAVPVCAVGTVLGLVGVVWARSRGAAHS